MDSHQRLVEALPVRTAPARSHRVSEKGMRAAAAALPLANPLQAAREIEHILDQMLATHWPAGERIAALEHLRAPVAALDAGAERQVASEPQPLPPAAAAWAASAQRLQAKLAAGYALGLHELCAPEGKLPRFKGKLAALGAVRALVHAGLALLWACRQYQSPPAGAWRRLHAVHAFAGELGLAGQAVEDTLADGIPLTPREAYAQIVLLALANPYRFAAREMLAAWQICRCLAGLCVLARASSDGVGVDTASDVGPGAIPTERLGISPGVLSVDVGPVERRLDARLGELPHGAVELDLAPPGGGRLRVEVAFVARLRAGWTLAARSYARLPAEHRLDVVVGMHALHYVLAGDSDFPSFVRQVHHSAVAAGRHNPSPAWSVPADPVRPQVLRGEVLDQSSGGYRLRLSAIGGLRVRIGDMVGLAPVVDDGDGLDWMVGVIRWLRRTDSGEAVSLGVELLRRQARAAGVLAVTVGGEQLAPMRAVELPGGADAARLSLLLAHPLGRAVSAVEVALPALASDWTSQAMVATWQPLDSETLGPACFRVTLGRATAAGER